MMREVLHGDGEACRAGCGYRQRQRHEGEYHQAHHDDGRPTCAISLLPLLHGMSVMLGRKMCAYGENRTDEFGNELCPAVDPKPYRAAYTTSNAEIALDYAGVWHGLNGPEMSRNDLA
jgi:hypothetical protein